MYAVIETGGKQYRVEVGTELEVELLRASAGDTITIDRVLLVADGETTDIGRPTVANASVSAEVVRQQRGDKVIAFKYRPKARRRVKHGHRQELHVVRIADIVYGGRSAAESVRRADSERRGERERLEEAAKRQAAEDAALAARLAAAKAPKAAEPTPGEAAPARPRTRTPKPEAKTARKASAEIDVAPEELAPAGAAPQPAPAAKPKARAKATTAGDADRALERGAEEPAARKTRTRKPGATKKDE